MNIEHSSFVPSVEAAAGAGLAILVALARAARERPAGDPALEAALQDLGDTTGETWLNLLGIPLDAGAPYTVERLLDAVHSADPVDLRRHLLGRHAWSWCALAGVDDIEAAAAGDRSAAGRLLEHPRYYAGQARPALSVLLALDPEETGRRLRAALEVAARVCRDDRTAALLAAESEARAVLDELPPLDAIDRLTRGFRYVPEPEAERVILVPHLESSPQLVLAQHRGARLIAYRAATEPAAEERLLTLGRALSDPKRVEILGLVARGTARAPDLVARTGLSRSTVHHHLSLLRDAGLVTLQGNARAYTFAPRLDAAPAAASLLADVLGVPPETDSKEE